MGEGNPSPTHLTPGELWKKSMKRAALSPGNVVSGAVSLATSAVLWNPLPLILWGLGSAGWLVHAGTSDKQLRRTVDEDRAGAEARSAADREALYQSLVRMLGEEPFATWAQSGRLPSYPDEFRKLQAMSERIAQILKERPEFEMSTEAGVSRQLSQMLAAYLSFVKARLTYLQILRSVPKAADPAPAPPPRMASQPRSDKRRGGVDVVPPFSVTPPPSIGEPLPHAGELLGSLDRRIEALKERAEREPAAASALGWHRDILEKQRTLLVECVERDQSIEAQLEAFPDAFHVILGQVSASQVDQGEILASMGSLVGRIEETERFVRAVAPRMDEILRGLPAAG